VGRIGSMAGRICGTGMFVFSLEWEKDEVMDGVTACTSCSMFSLNYLQIKLLFFEREKIPQASIQHANGNYRWRARLC